ncbi:nucleus accumbens-associated protein 2-like [Thalassophryne amazonica]|uniref:nucleus accumbens-associated protein 2-like n=1 Tax=Thalassophryne amazonica TaxID=390379 RepID=UPI001470B5D5|nr:nucleus accumbens-associated protein 2-like [Thalassophryne amazonica]
MAEGLLQVEIPDFGSSVLGSLNEQRLLGQYCDVSILVQGQAFKAHRAVLAASSLYFRDLFSSSSSSQPVYELPSSVTPACFQHILSFCYTGRLSMAASEQLVLMYTAGYLQIQNIVERGMELLLLKTSAASSPLCCDSQTTSADELSGFSAPLVQQHSTPQLQEAEPSSEELLLAVSRIKQERADTPPAEEPAGGAGEEVRLDMNTEHQVSRTSALCYLGAGGSLIPAFQSYLLTNGGRSSPAASSLPADSPPSHHTTEEELDEEYYSSAVQPSVYQHIYGHAYSNCFLAFCGLHRNTLANSCGTGIRSSTNDPSRKPLDNRVLNTVKLYCQNFAPGFKESEMNVIAADMCTNARRVRKRWLPKIQSILPDGLPATSSHQCKSKRGGGGGQGGEARSSSSPPELDLRQLSTSNLGLEVLPYGERQDRESTETGRDSPTPRLQLPRSHGGRAAEEVLMGVEVDQGGRLQTEQVPDLPLPVSSSSSSHSSPQSAESAPSHGRLAEGDEKRVEPLEDGQ